MKAPKAINIVDQQDCGDKGMARGLDKKIFRPQRISSGGYLARGCRWRKVSARQSVHFEDQVVTSVHLRLTSRG